MLHYWIKKKYLFSDCLAIKESFVLSALNIMSAVHAMALSTAQKSTTHQVTDDPSLIITLVGTRAIIKVKGHQYRWLAWQLPGG